jgi:hypothetical protein
MGEGEAAVFPGSSFVRPSPALISRHHSAPASWRAGDCIAEAEGAAKVIVGASWWSGASRIGPGVTKKQKIFSVEA